MSPELIVFCVQTDVCAAGRCKDRYTVLLYIRNEDAAIMAAICLSLVLVYICVLLIKTCARSEVVCETYGFGSKPNGASLPLRE